MLVQMSVAMLVVDVVTLNFPDGHAWHWGCVVTVPAAFVYFPGGHLVWVVQEAVLTLLLDTASLKNPAAHVSHWGWAVMVPGTLVNLPLGHLVWAAHGQPIGNM